VFSFGLCTFATQNFKKMKLTYSTIFMSILTLTACEKAIVPEGDEFSTEKRVVTGSAHLNIITNATNRVGNEMNIVGKIYVFNSEGSCVQVLSSGEEGHQFSSQLPADLYTLYAVGAEDLSRFNLPDQEEATPASVISLQAGKKMDDLLMATATVDLASGETLNQNISLEHKVFCLDDIEIRQVPASATRVEISFAPIYSTVCLDGSYPESPTESYKIALTKQADGRTWKAKPSQMMFPSKGKPTIKVSIVTDEATLSYSYTSTELLEANHYFTIVGTYQASQGVQLTGILTSSEWGEDRTITFDIHEDDVTTAYHLEAGQLYNGYYVVSLDKTNKSAVLLAKEKVDYTAPTEDTNEATWKTALEAAMATLEKPSGATGNWRLPTLEEAKIFTNDTKATYFGQSACTPNFFCLDGETLKWAYTRIHGGTHRFESGTGQFSGMMHLRPVIDMKY